MELIARKKEIDALENIYKSKRSEFVIVYGRRRIGKTFLVNKVFANRFTFTYVGARDLSQKEQIDRFARQLKEYSASAFLPKLESWDDAFYALRELIDKRPKKERKVIFFDEMPWIDTPRSGFVAALEYFWNAWAAQRDDVVFVACGSATSWMVNKLVKNRGGLYNRITSHIYLRPFTVGECEEYLHSQGCAWDRYTILQCYMALGGVPFYWSLLDKKESLAQNIDRLFFSKNAVMKEEFDELYNALFRNAEQYISVVKCLAKKREGLLRSELVEKTKVSGGGLTKILENLERCDFIESYSRYKSKSRDALYRITDHYTMFYFKFIATGNNRDSQFWSHNLSSPSIRSWLGFGFEMICLTHLEQIKKALGVNAIATSSCSWRKRGDSSSEGAQIDLLIERADRIINICEIKFSETPFVITKSYEENLRNKMAVFREETRTRLSFALTMITTFGVMKGAHYSVVSNEVTMDDLFERTL